MILVRIALALYYVYLAVYMQFCVIYKATWNLSKDNVWDPNADISTYSRFNYVVCTMLWVFYMFVIWLLIVYAGIIALALVIVMFK